MANFRIKKVVAALPSTLTPDTLYVVRVGEGFDLYATDTTGSIAHRVNVGARIHIGATAPDPSQYALWITLEGNLFAHDGDFWFQVGSGVGSESDPLFVASAAAAITGADIAAWNTSRWAERRLIATQDMVNNTSMQDWFTTEGGLGLDANSTYEFEGTFFSLNGASSHGLNMQFAAISGGIIQWNAYGAKVVAASQATGIRVVATNTFNTARNVTTASTVAGNMVRVWGSVITGAGGGTLRPQVAQSAASGSFTLQPGTFFRARRLGADTLVNVGGWA